MTEHQNIWTPHRAHRGPPKAGGTAPLEIVDDGTEPQSARTHETLIGQRFRLRAHIGRGRLGDIYEAEDLLDTDLDAPGVAVQLLRERGLSEQRFFNELRRNYTALRDGAHPNIVKILDFGRDGKRHYLVMELLEGLSLREVLDETTVLPLDQTAAIVRAVGHALEFLHAKSMVHGHVRLRSVFITYDYAVKLLDIAPLVRPPAPYYVEDAGRGAQGNDDRRDDVFGLACLTYELLSGKHPFNANTPIEAHRAGLEPTPPQGLSTRQWQALSRALALSRADRTPTVTTFLSELDLVSTHALRDLVDADSFGPAPDSETLRTPAEDPPADDRARADGAASGTAMSRPRPLPRRPQPSHRPRTYLLLLLAVVLGGVTYLRYDVFKQRAVDLFAGADTRGGGAVVAAVEPGANGTEPARTGRESAPSAATEHANDDGLAGEIGTGEAAGRSTGDNAGLEESDAETAEAAALANAPGDADRASELAADDAQVTSSAESEPADGAVAVGMAPVAFGAPVTTVSESQASAQLVIRRNGDLARAASFVWWSSEHTARAGDDYADLGQRLEDFAAGEQSRIIHIPLVRDAQREPPESFYVYLGRLDPAQGRLDVLASARVDIRDDD